MAKETRSHLRIRKGDTVLVMAGKDKGKKGKVLRTIPSENKVVVERVNMIKRHQKRSKKVMQGGIVEQEAPVSAANVMFFCTRCQKPTRLGAKNLETGKKVRLCKKCGEVLDK
ncbi:MAG: 50S ribosomal protein L24 [Bacillota bacterium]